MLIRNNKCINMNFNKSKQETVNFLKVRERLQYTGFDSG